MVGISLRPFTQIFIEVFDPNFSTIKILSYVSQNVKNFLLFHTAKILSFLKQSSSLKIAPA